MNWEKQSQVFCNIRKQIKQTNEQTKHKMCRDFPSCIKNWETDDAHKRNGVNVCVLCEWVEFSLSNRLNSSLEENPTECFIDV